LAPSKAKFYYNPFAAINQGKFVQFAEEPAVNWRGKPCPTFLDSRFHGNDKRIGGLKPTLPFYELRTQLTVNDFDAFWVEVVQVRQLVSAKVSLN
jgi:hypothetical protein